METFWFIALALMLIMYVILDGFDLGAGIVHLLAAKNNQERRAILKAIGPVWDGNEVWLLSAGGVLFFAFPRLYASSFSGFYLPLIMVLWLLMLRGIGIEFRHHIENEMWQSFWDVVFSLASLLLVLFFGAALGNVVRGVPLNENGVFFEPLWTTFTVVPKAGILDWFTVLMGLIAIATLTAHGANYVAMKTEGQLAERARRISGKAALATIILSLLAIAATFVVREGLWDRYFEHPWGFLFPLLGIAAMVGMQLFRSRGQDVQAFLSSALFIAGMGGATAFGMYPNVLPASTNPQYNLTIFNTSAGAHGLQVGLVWWLIGIVLATGYFSYLFYSFRGKIKTV